jgi:hypothetical protein
MKIRKAWNGESFVAKRKGKSKEAKRNAKA